MEALSRAKAWVDDHRDVFLDLIRIYLGLGLVARGVAFLGRARELLDSATAGPQLDWAAGTVGHFVVVAHVAGGFLLAVGLLTRVAAALNVPVLLGAVLFVHAGEGLFTFASTLEFTLLVLFLLGVFTVSGAGRLSVDGYVAAHALREQPA